MQVTGAGETSDCDVAVRIGSMLRVTSLPIRLGYHSHQEAHEKSPQCEEYDSQEHPLHMGLPPFSAIVIMLGFVATISARSPSTSLASLPVGNSLSLPTLCPGPLAECDSPPELH